MGSLKGKKNEIFSIICICMQGIRKWLSDYRVYLLFLLEFAVIFSKTREMVTPFLKNNLGINGFGIFPVLYNNQVGIFRFIFMFGMILLYCDAPFFDRNQQFVFLRAGRTIWNFGQLLYIFVSAVLYLLLNVLVSILSCLPNLGFSFHYWGEAFWTMTSINIETVIVSPTFLLKYTPWQAFYHGLLVIFLFTLFMGYFIYTLNLLFGKGIGVFAGSFIVCGSTVIDVLSYWDQKATLSYLFPSFMTKIGYIDTDHIGGYPSYHYVYAFFSISIMSLIAISIAAGRKAEMSTADS